MFSGLLEERNYVSRPCESQSINGAIYIQEFQCEISVREMSTCTSIFKAKREKECGVNGKPFDVFRNDASVSIVLFLLYVCLFFQSFGMYLHAIKTYFYGMMHKETPPRL